MLESDAEFFLSKELNFQKHSIDQIKVFKKELLEYNSQYNLISKTSESHIWIRHILDSAQLVKFIDFKDNYSLSDLGTGAGFPGIILAIFNKNNNFHVNLYEKSPIKCKFLEKIKQLLKLNVEIIEGDIKNHKLSSDYIVCRAFKKLGEIVNISREISTKSHKLIILKGKSAQNEINSTSQFRIYKYKLVSSITDKESKIIIADVKK